MGLMLICHIVCTCEEDQYLCNRGTRLCTKRPTPKKRPIWDPCLYVTLSVRVKETNMCVNERFVCVQRDLFLRRDLYGTYVYMSHCLYV